MSGIVAAAAQAETQPPVAAAQAPVRSSADTLRLSLDDGIQMALSRGEEVKLAQADRATARALYLQARSSVLPQLTLNVSYAHQYESIYGNTSGDFFVWQPDTLASLENRIRDLENALPGSGFMAVSQLLSAFASQNSWNAALDVRQKIFQGGSLWNSVAAASHALSAAALLEADRRDDVTFNVRQAYLNALLAARTERIAQLALEQADNQLERTRLRHEAGNASDFDLLQAEVERDNQVPLVHGAHTLREVAYLNLRRLTNVPAGRPLALISPLLDDGAVPADPMAIDTTGLAADAMRASGVESMEEAVAARGHAVSVAAAAKYPELSLYANLSQQAFPTGTLPESGDWRRQKSAGVTLSWNVFDGFLTKGQVAEAKSNLSRTTQQLAQTRELVNVAIEQGRLELERSAADLKARSRTVELARKALDLATLRFDEGAASRLEVSDARLAWQIAQSNEAQARRDYFVALALLERYSGRPVFQSIVHAEVK